MRRFSIVLATLLFLLFAAGIGAQEAQTEMYKKHYDISVRTYQTVSNDKYQRIYNKVQDNSKRVMMDAARDACRAEGGRLQDDFSCKTRR